jgi:hypothetical protein
VPSVGNEQWAGIGGRSTAHQVNPVFRLTDCRQSCRCRRRSWGVWPKDCGVLRPCSNVQRPPSGACDTRRGSPGPTSHENTLGRGCDRWSPETVWHEPHPYCRSRPPLGGHRGVIHRRRR